MGGVEDIMDGVEVVPHPTQQSTIHCLYLYDAAEVLRIVIIMRDRHRRRRRRHHSLGGENCNGVGLVKRWYGIR